ncbi:MAG: hypothetical protein AAGJ96_00980 [Pseudomonadota bacterium]
MRGLAALCAFLLAAPVAAQTPAPAPAPAPAASPIDPKQERFTEIGVTPTGASFGGSGAGFGVVLTLRAPISDTTTLAAQHISGHDIVNDIFDAFFFFLDQSSNSQVLNTFGLEQQVSPVEAPVRLIVGAGVARGDPYHGQLTDDGSWGWTASAGVDYATGARSILRARVRHIEIERFGLGFNASASVSLVDTLGLRLDYDYTDTMQSAGAGLTFMF